jgi:UDP-4-amino-4,6-dideoxy-N-acetyl-beta-L-altrosamine transaminase
MIPYGRQLVEEDDIQAVVNVMRSDWLTSGPAVEIFEQALAARITARHVLACSSGTAALHMATIAAGLRPGDQAIVPTVTFLATANAVCFTGANVVFADVDADTGLLTPQSFLEALTRADASRIKAVLPVHLAGQCPDMEGIIEIARQYGVLVIEDAAHAIGSTFIDRHGKRTPVGSGALGDIATFSFHPVKTIAMGEGGAVSTNSDELAEKMSLARNHGMTRDQAVFRNDDAAFDAQGNVNPWYYEMHHLGYNYRASDLHCALGTSQLAKLDRFIDHRSRLIVAYDAAIQGNYDLLKPLERTPFGEPAWHLYPVLIDFAKIGKSRLQVMVDLREKGIGTQVHYIPVHSQPYYRQQNASVDFTGAQTYYERTLSLPLHTSMEIADVDQIVETLFGILRA